MVGNRNQHIDCIRSRKSRISAVFAVWHADCKVLSNTLKQRFQIDFRETQIMYNRTFFGTKLGQASLASIAAMTAMIALTSQMNLGAAGTNIAGPAGETTMLIELA